METMSKKLKLYTLLIIGIGIAILTIGMGELRSFEDIGEVLFFAFLGIVAESLTIRVKGNTGISVGFAIGVGAALVLNPYTTAIMSFSAFLFAIEKIDGKYEHMLNSSVYKRLFNGSVFGISATAAGLTYNYLAHSYNSIEIAGISVVGTIFSMLVYIVINVIVFAALMAIIENKSLFKTIRTFDWAVKNFFGLAPLGVVLAAAFLSYGWLAVLLFFGPLLVARYSFILYMDMRHVYFETIKALSSAMEAKDKYTNGHSYRVADYAVGIAEQMGYTHDAIDRIKTAAVLHDIGKIGISDSILNKPGHLEDNEYVAIQKHPEIGAKILSEVEFLGDVSKIIKYHHERFDGKGYPEGLKDAEIPMEASILAVADAYDAMTSDRPYRKAMDSHTAMNILVKESGIQFNPIVVKAFRDYLRKHGGEMAHVG